MRRPVQRLSLGLSVLTVVLTCAGTTLAQGGNIRGRLFLPNGTYLNESVRVSLETGRGVKSTIFTDNQGQYYFPGLTPGTYTIIVEGDRTRFETTTVNIEVFPNAPAIINIVLKDKKNNTPAKNGNSISVMELDSRVPDKAKKEFDRASGAAAEGKAKEAIAHLRNAISIYPNYLMARNDLGAQLLGQGKLDEAAEEFRKALELDGKAFNPNLNLGIVLVQQQKFGEALAYLKTAVALDSTSPAARLYNGMALEGTNDYTEAERELKAAHELGGDVFALALFYLAEAYLNRGEPARAAAALRDYLREAPTGPKAQEARTLLATIR